jgi:hypothetical protein
MGNVDWQRGKKQVLRCIRLAAHFAQDDKSKIVTKRPTGSGWPIDYGITRVDNHSWGTRVNKSVADRNDQAFHEKSPLYE